jgi:hypothetical protein
MPAPVRARRSSSRRTTWIAVGVAGIAALIALGVSLTTHKAQPIKPQIVSGRAGPKLTTSGAPQRWWQNDVTVTVDASLANVWPDSTTGVATAFDSWRSADGQLPKITFDARPSGQILLEPDGENRIYYAPITVAGHENDLAITLQYADQTTGEVVESDIIVNSRHPFAVLESETADDGSGESTSGNVASCSAKYDVASVVTHEIGHFWGLGEDVVDTNATMYFSTPPCNVLKRHLKTDDVRAVSSLYSAPVPSSDSTRVAHCAVTSLGHASTGGVAMLGVMLVVGATARRRRALTSPRA